MKMATLAVTGLIRAAFVLSVTLFSSIACLVVLFFTMILVSGCAHTEEGEWMRQVEQANWANCEALYQRAGVPTQHRHRHDGKYPFPQREDIWDDLNDNACRINLGDEWIEY